MMAEEERLSALRSYELLDTPADQRFDRITRLSSNLFATPIAMITLIDLDRQWSKSAVGMPRSDAPRCHSFCSHTIELGGNAVMVIPDATQDTRFAASPFVTGNPGIRFYAGATLTTPSGHNLGALCVVDTKPREAPSATELALLQTLASFVVDELELIRRTRVIDEHERLFKLTQSMAGVGYWRYDARAGHLMWSDAVYTIHGVDRANFDPTPQTISALYLDAGDDSFEQLLEQALRTGQGFTARFMRDRSNGDFRYLDYKVTCVRGSADEVSAVIGVLQDVTEQVEAFRRAEGTATKLRLLAENTNSMVTHVGRDGRRLYVSPASEGIFGIHHDELVESDVMIKIHPDDRATIMQWRRRLLSGRFANETRMFRVVEPSGKIVWIETSVQSVTCPVTGEPDGYISVSRNVSDRRAVMDALRASEERLRIANADLEQLTRHLTKARDQAERSSEAKSRFLASMSHELRTPLHGILGYAQMLRRESTLTSSQATCIDAMLAAGTHLHAMINSVLNLSAIESGSAEATMADIDISDFIATCLDLVRPKAKAKGIALIRHTLPGLPVHLKSDATRLRQILVNLLGNALKFTPSGHVTLGVTRLDGDTALRFSVADTGPGIPQEHRSRIFREFERLDAVVSTNEEGMGLGLAISTRLAIQLGSRLNYEDGVEGGSVFSLDLPIDGLDLPFESDGKFRAREASRAARMSPDADLDRPGQLTILVVDDVEINRDIACSFLRSAGHTAVVAQGGFEAVAMVADGDFDIVLMDVRMPGVDGLEASRRIRKLNGPQSTVPIVAVTAQAFAEQVEECRAAGMTSHLSKPFTAADLLSLVANTALNGARRTMPSSFHVPAPSAEPLIEGADRPPALPILNIEAFERTASVLPAEAVRRHTATLTDRFNALLLSLSAPDAVSSDRAELADAAHTVAGSAGMFGFERLTSIAKAFEHAAYARSPDIADHSDRLIATLRESLIAIHAQREVAYGAHIEHSTVPA